MELEKTLREKVFEACDSIKKSGEKITRDKVREQTGGSDRDLSQYIKEWKESTENAITLANSSEISQQNQESVAISALVRTKFRTNSAHHLKC